MAKGTKKKEVEDVQYWEQKAKVANMEIINLQNELDLAYQKHDEILDDLIHWKNQCIEAIMLCNSLTGEITKTDIEYNINAINRIIQHKYRFKSQD